MHVSNANAAQEATGLPGGPNHQPSGTLVIGIGNSLLCDDGAGVHVINRLRETSMPGGVELIDGGTLSFTLLEHVEKAAHLIVVDAAELSAAAGTIDVLHDQALDEFLASNRRPSVHEVNLLDVLTAARFRGCYPPRCTLVGIQPQHVGWSATPSPVVARAVDQAADIILGMINENAAGGAA